MRCTDQMLAKAAACLLAAAWMALPLAAHAQDASAGKSAPKGPWVAPAEEKARANPIPASAEAIQKGRDLYEENCAACHGLGGRGDGPTAATRGFKVPAFTHSDWAKSVTDGELFWKISTGRAPMKAYEEMFSETERWQLVDYVRTFAQAGQAARPMPKVESASAGASLLPAVPTAIGVVTRAPAQAPVMEIYEHKQLLVLSLMAAIVLGAFMALVGPGPGAPVAVEQHEAHGHH